MLNIDLLLAAFTREDLLQLLQEKIRTSKEDFIIVIVVKNNKESYAISQQSTKTEASIIKQLHAHYKQLEQQTKSNLS